MDTRKWLMRLMLLLGATGLWAADGEWKPEPLLSGTQLELGLRSYDLERQLLRLLLGLDGGGRLYLLLDDQQRSEPVIGFRGKNVLAGPVALAGLHRARRAPTGHGPESSVWSESAELRVDFAFEPGSRRGAQLRFEPAMEYRFTLYCVEEGGRTPECGVVLGRRSGPYSLELLSGLSQPPQASTSSDWFLERRGYPGGELLHSAINLGVDAGPAEIGLAGGLSYGPRVRTGSWGRGLVTLGGPPAELRLLGALSSPEFRRPDGAMAAPARYTDISLRIPGQGRLTLLGGVASRQGAEPYSVQLSPDHRREFRVRLEFAGELLTLRIGGEVENLRSTRDEASRRESIHTRVGTGSSLADGLRASVEYQLSRTVEPSEPIPGFGSRTRLSFAYRVGPVRLELDGTHRREHEESVSLRGAAFLSHKDWSSSVIVSSTVDPVELTGVDPQEWSMRLELRRMLRVR